jgi:RNA polymerase sigma-70 factor (family 1)
VEEKNLWTEIQRGNKAALKQLHNKYYHQMHLYAAKSISSGMAEEMVSDCFIKLWESRKNIQINSSVKHYLFVMLHNSIIDHHRKRKWDTEPITENIPVPGDEKFFDDQKQYALLYLAIKKLPEQCRRILELAVFESFSYKEIAEKMNISHNTVKTQMGRAYRSLKETLRLK